MKAYYITSDNLKLKFDFCFPLVKVIIVCSLEVILLMRSYFYNSSMTDKIYHSVNERIKIEI